MSDTISDNTREFYIRHVECYPFMTRMPVNAMSIGEHKAIIELIALGVINVNVVENGCISYEFHKLKDSPQ